MQIKVMWEYPDYYTNPDDTTDYFEEDDDASQDEIDKDAGDVAYEHFAWSWEKIDEHTLRVYWEVIDFVTAGSDYDDVEIDGDESDSELDKIADETANEHFDWSYEVVKNDD